MKLPEHKCGLYLTHNEHKDIYESLPKWLENIDHFDWICDDERELALLHDNIWVLQWYPNTPIGFHAFAASTLEALLTYVNKNYPEVR